MCVCFLRTERAAMAPRKRLGDAGVSPHQKYTHNTRASLEIQACPFCLFCAAEKHPDNLAAAFIPIFNGEHLFVVCLFTALSRL